MLKRLVGFLTVLSLAVFGLVAPSSPAQAELVHPRQAWLRDATAGLFLHWGLRTNRGPGLAPWTNTDCANWENEVSSSGWSADKWVHAAQQLHAQYLVLATFHSRLGYARPWPSKIPGSCSTQRDFLGETIAAAKAKGLKVLLYMTDDPKWFWEGLQPPTPAPDPNDLTKPSWFDSAAYSAFKGHQVNLNTRPGFGEFSYDNFFEVMKNYPDLAGFWIDNLNKYWTDPANDLFGKIRQQRPDMLLSNNNEDTPLFDTVSNEQKTGMTPPYDYASALWTSMPRLTESDYKLPTAGGWWYDGEGADHAGGAPVDYKLTIGRLMSNVGSSSKALEAETSKVNGDFPANQQAFNDFMQTYLTPIWESIHGVEGGGYMFGGLKPGQWTDGAYGFTTVSKFNADLHYIHVIDRPAGDMFRLRDNGYKVKSVTDLRTGEKIKFSQAAGTLTLEGITNWDPYDTVFKVVTNDRTGIYPPGTVSATVDSMTPGHDGSTLVDGNYLTWWENAPATITLDLGKPGKLAYLALNEREWSTTQPRGSEDSARIKGYRIETSLDGTTWTTVIACATLPSVRAVQFIDLDVKKARFVKMTILNNWSASNRSKYFNNLKIDEMWVGSGYPGGGRAPLPLPDGPGCNAGAPLPGSNGTHGPPPLA